MDRAATMLDLMIGETDPKKKPRKKYISNGVEINQFKDAIIAPENSGNRNYVAMNPESSATGAYQILYNPMKDELATKYGVRSRQDFANNPYVQEEVMDQLAIKYALDSIDRSGKRICATTWRQDAQATRSNGLNSLHGQRQD